ncbi:MAG: O-antigen ligase family protein, partial [Planctomycetota bacterium]
HPTAAGSTAALGLVLVALCGLSDKFSWSAQLVLPAILIHAPTAYFSHSRSALAMAAITVFAGMFYFGGRFVRAALAISVAGVALVIMIADPGLHLVAGDNAMVGYLLRGQDLSQLAEGSGRGEMWNAIWTEFRSSGAWIKGHGYFVTSRTGELYVWYHYANHPAHNIFLQVLVSTGLIGLAIWLSAQLGIAARLVQLRSGDSFSRTYLAILCLIAIWFAGWSIGSTSFMGPVRWESVTYYTLIGLGMGLVGSMSGGKKVSDDDQDTELKHRTEPSHSL